jgi:hypothetical protein
MCSDVRAKIDARFAALDDAVTGLLELSFDVLTTPERLGLLEHLEQQTRRLPVAGHTLINQVAHQASETELGGTLCQALANRLRISRAEAGRRIGEAEDLGPRQSVTGQPLPPRLEATAAAQHAGAIGAGHVAVIRKFLAGLPGWIDAATAEQAQAKLARQATHFRPDQLAKLADKLTDCLNPDGDFTDDDRARRRELILGNQGPDQMSPIRGWLDPKPAPRWKSCWPARRPPAMANPADATPRLNGTPSEQASKADDRSPAQRAHDALAAALRAAVASGTLGHHNGLPASIVITTTLQDLEAAAGTARTGGGSLLPLSDVIRMAQHAHNYLAIFDKAKPLALLHRKRIAAPAQRLMLYAAERGCSHPACDVPPYYTEAHHVIPWAKSRQTNIHHLALGCRPHHRITEHGWTTRKNHHGLTEWIPPPHSPASGGTPIAANPASTPSTTPKNSSRTATTTKTTPN